MCMNDPLLPNGDEILLLNLPWYSILSFCSLKDVCQIRCLSRVWKEHVEASFSPYDAALLLQKQLLAKNMYLSLGLHIPIDCKIKAESLASFFCQDNVCKPLLRLLSTLRVFAFVPKRIMAEIDGQCVTKLSLYPHFPEDLTCPICKSKGKSKHYRNPPLVPSLWSYYGTFTTDEKLGWLNVNLELKPLEHLYRCAASGPYPFGTLKNRLAGSLFEEFLPFGIFIGVFKQSAKVGSLVCGCGLSFFASKLVDLRRIKAPTTSPQKSEAFGIPFTQLATSPWPTNMHLQTQQPTMTS